MYPLNFLKYNKLLLLRGEIQCQFLNLLIAIWLENDIFNLRHLELEFRRLALKKFNVVGNSYDLYGLAQYE